jgi:hypothetical protein
MSDQPATPSGTPSAVSVGLHISADALPETPGAYANFVQASFSPLDVTMRFSWYATPALEAPPPPTADRIEVPTFPVGIVTIPLGLVRPLAQLLNSLADGWESNTGHAIPDPNVFGQRFASTDE